MRRNSGIGLLLWLLITLGINVLALLVVNWIFDSIAIEGFWSYALGALALTVGNSIFKPVLAILTLPLVVLTLGLAYFAINVLMLAFAEWVAPNFSIDGFWTYVGATIVVWAVNVAMDAFVRATSRKRPSSATT
jgi:putative membrane protein